MDAVIYRVASRTDAAGLSVAGTPVLLRQLQWLRAAGCDRIVVEVGAENVGAVERLLDNPLCAGATLLPTGEPAGPHELARRAGLPIERPFVALPCDLVGDGDLWELFARDGGTGVVGVSIEPEGFASVPLPCVLLARQGPRSERSVVTRLSSWGVRVTSELVAHRLSMALLEGRIAGPPVHGAEVSPGVFRARGARVEPGAVMRGPVYLGPGCVVSAGAVVGPHAVIGARAVIEPGATVTRATVADDTVVGEGLALEGCAASPEGVREFEGAGGVVPLGDPLLLTARGGSGASGALGMLFAAALLALVAPLVLLARALGVGRARAEGAWSSLGEVFAGTRAWVGVGDGSPGADEGLELERAAARAPRGVVHIDEALVPEGADGPTRLRARAWYSLEKSASLDAVLLWRLVRGARPAF